MREPKEPINALQAIERVLEQNQKLRTKNRNYRTTLRQLQRAHFISKELLRRYQTSEMVALEELQVELDKLRYENERLMQENHDILSSLPMPVTFAPSERTLKA